MWCCVRPRRGRGRRDKELCASKKAEKNKKRPVLHIPPPPVQVVLRGGYPERGGDHPCWLRKPVNQARTRCKHVVWGSGVSFMFVARGSSKQKVYLAQSLGAASRGRILALKEIAANWRWSQPCLLPCPPYAGAKWGRRRGSGGGGGVRVSGVLVRFVLAVVRSKVVSLGIRWPDTAVVNGRQFPHTYIRTFMWAARVKASHRLQMYRQ